MSDDTGDYAPPEGEAAGINLRGAYTPPAGSALLLNLRYVYYHPPKGNLVGLDLTGAYTPPAGNLVGLNLTNDDAEGGGTTGLAQYVFPLGADGSDAAPPVVWLAFQGVAVGGIPAPSEPHQHDVRLDTRYIKPTGLFASVAPPRPTVRNWTLQAFPAGLVATAYGRPYIWNHRQYIKRTGQQSELIDALYGMAFVQGGVKYVLPLGLNANAFGRAVLVNTTANQTVTPLGMAAPALTKPHVSPRTLWPTSIYGTMPGFPVVQFPPQPKGWQSSAFGRPSIEDKTRRARGEGFDSYVTGYATVRDRAQRVYHHASDVTSIFGDIATRLKVQRLVGTGFDSSEIGRFAEIRSTRRTVLVTTFDALAFGQDTQARNKTPSLSPTGFGAPLFGNADVGWRVRAINPPGISAPLTPVSAPSLWQTPGIRPAGLPPPLVPMAVIGHGIRTVTGVGADTALYGVPKVGLRYRFVQLEDKAQDASAHGKPRLEHGIRQVIAHGMEHQAHGKPWVSFRIRILSPEGAVLPRPASAHMVGGRRFILADGFVATAFGTRIIPVRQYVDVLGFAGVFGLAVARNTRRFLLPPSMTTFPQPYQSWGTARAWNRRQIVTQDYIDGSGLTPPSWPQWTAIDNRNKTMRTFGADASRIGAPFVQLGARAILPGGFRTQAPTETTMAAYRIRHVRPDAMDAPGMTRWMVVANAAAVLKPAGFVASLFGAADVQSNRRFIVRVGNFDAQWIDRPFIAPRIRTVFVESRYGIAPPLPSLPSVQLLTRYIDADAQGIKAQEVGRAALNVVWRGLIPRWTHRDFFGSPVLRNLTPELGGRGWNAEEFGVPFVRLEWRALPVDGFEPAAIGRHRVADKLQGISVGGASYMVVSDKLKVIRVGGAPDPQTISLHMLGLTGESDPKDSVGFGIEVPAGQVPEPALNQHVIYPSGFKATDFGTARVDSNGIRVEPGIADYGYGEPHIGLLHRQINVAGMDMTIKVGKPRMSPLTIWAVMEAPDQAKKNHDQQNLHYVWSNPSNNQAGARLGVPKVDNQHRVLRPAWIHQERVGGGVRAMNRRQYVAPDGTSQMRFGWHTIPGTQYVEPFKTPDTSLYGVAVVSRGKYLGPQTVAPKGIVDIKLPPPVIQLLHRILLAKGEELTRMGGIKQHDQPYMWQGLRVGELMPTIPEGFCIEVFGLSWVSLGTRDVRAEGTDMFVSEYDFMQFPQRMRVRNAKSLLPAAQHIAASGHQSSACGWQQAKPMRHYIRPDGNSDQHRKGAPVA